MYRYVFYYDCYDYGESLIFLNKEKYTDDEFKSICDNVMHDILIDYICDLDITAFFPDDDILEADDTCPNSLYLLFNEHTDAFIQNMNKLGFNIEESLVQARLTINNDSYLKEMFSSDINNIMSTRSKNEDIPILTEEEEHRFYEIEMNSGGVKTRNELIKEILDERKKTT